MESFSSLSKKDGGASILRSTPLLALAIAAFGIGTSEFIIMGLLPNLAQDFLVSIPKAGVLVTGYALSVTIGSDGTVSVTQPSQTQATQVGTIQLAMFPNPGGLNSIGNNLMLATTASGDPIVGTPGGAEGIGKLQQGFVEQSNVDVVQEFVDMILSQRSYESNSRVVKAADEMFQDLNSLTR